MSNKDIIINMVLMKVGLHYKSCQTYTQFMKKEQNNNCNKYFVMYTIYVTCFNYFTVLRILMNSEINTEKKFKNEFLCVK